MLSAISAKVMAIPLCIAVMLLGVQTLRVSWLKAEVADLSAKYYALVADNEALSVSLSACHSVNEKQLKSVDEEIKRLQNLNEIMCDFPEDIQYVAPVEVKPQISQRQSDDLVVYWNDLFRPFTKE